MLLLEARRTVRALNHIPTDILNNADINSAIEILPHNYSFEIPKTIHRIRSSGAKKVALQFPEGLLLFATTISDILTQFCPGVETLIMGDVTYGACCIDDYTARALDCDMLVHYAHSCLIPVDVTRIATLYVFVTIGIDTSHFIETVVNSFPRGKRIAMVGTIQFNPTLHATKGALERAGLRIVIPQVAPLSKGEILGCTAPNLKAETNIKAADSDIAISPSTRDLLDKKEQTNESIILLYVGDGRFHLESALITNPYVPTYRYDPYARRLTREHYDHSEMHALRHSAISKAKQAKVWGLILGALGRQGNPHTLEAIKAAATRKGICTVVLLLSEIFPGKLAQMPDIGAWVQVACPRLSIDWGYAFPRPLLSPYEALIALDLVDDWGSDGEGTYPMNYYAKDGLGRVKAEDTSKANAVVAGA